MKSWHVWGDYVHTMPKEIGCAAVLRGSEERARKVAEAHGFDFERRLRNGFEPWTATFTCDEGVDAQQQEFAFASYATVRGWQRI
jgi:hypothetical protein